MSKERNSIAYYSIEIRAVDKGLRSLYGSTRLLTRESVEQSKFSYLSESAKEMVFHLLKEIEENG